MSFEGSQSVLSISARRDLIQGIGYRYCLKSEEQDGEGQGKGGYGHHTGTTGGWSELTKAKN